MDEYVRMEEASSNGFTPNLATSRLRFLKIILVLGLGVVGFIAFHASNEFRLVSSDRNAKESFVPEISGPCLLYDPKTDLKPMFRAVPAPDSEFISNHFFSNSSVPLIPNVKLNNGDIMPIIAAGTWQYDAESAYNSVTRALKAGFTHIDTAHDYNNQVAVGSAVSAYLSKTPSLSRKDLFITTKVPGCGSNGVTLENCAADTRFAITDDLLQLNMSFVDLILIHFGPVGPKVKKGCKNEENCELIRNQWKVLQHAFMMGQTKTIGVSNFCISCLECLRTWKGTTVTPAVNQIKFHIGMFPSESVQSLLNYHTKHGIVSQAYSPLGDNSEQILNSKTLSDIAKTYNKTTAQIALKFVLQNNLAVVTKSSKTVHLKEDLEVADESENKKWKISEEDMKRLNEIETPKGKPSFTCDE